MPRSKFRRRTAARLALNRLEDRVNPVNLQVTGVSIVDAYYQPEPVPVTGQKIFVKMNWNVTGAAGGSYGIQAVVDGVPLGGVNYSVQNGSYTYYFSGWYLGPGLHTVHADVDINNTVAETNENDNTQLIIVSPQAPTDLPSKFIRPIYGPLNSLWVIGNYADVDPRSGLRADYRGGTFQYDGHDAIDAGPTEFSKTDAGIPIYAAADGVVTEVLDGVFDRQTTTTGIDGNHIWIDHGNNWQTLYYHMSANTITVKVGDHVKQGQVIGLMGSSGNTTGPHLHFTPFYRGCQVEMGYDTAAYETDPMPYSGDVASFALDSGVSPYDPSTDLAAKERPSTISTISTTQSSTSLQAWLWAFHLVASDTVSVSWYRPNNTLYSSGSYNISQDLSTGYVLTGAFPWSAWSSALGTWSMKWSINGVVKSTNLFTVTSGAGVPEMRVIDTTGAVVTDNRTTPFSMGTAVAIGSPSTKTFIIENLGGATLTLSNPVLPPRFSLVGGLPASIAAGASGQFTVRFDGDYTGFDLGAVRFDTNDPAIGAYEFNVSGGGATTPVLGAPTIDLPDPALGYGFKQQGAPIAPNATVTDNFISNLGNGSFQVEFAAGDITNADQLGIQFQGNGPGQISTFFGSVLYSGNSIGTYTGGTGSTPLVVTLNASANPPAVQALARAIYYVNTGAIPRTARLYVRYTVTDHSGNSDDAIAYITPSGTNRPPVASAGGPYTHIEGASQMFDATATSDVEGDPLTYSWDINGDNVFGDATGPNPTLTAAQLENLGLNDGPNVISNVRVQVSDGVNGTVTSPATSFTDVNFSPIAVFSANKTTIPVNGDTTVSFSFIYEPSTADSNAGLRFSYDLNNDGTYEFGNGYYSNSISSNIVAIPGSVYFTTPGSHTVHGRIIDKDNGFTDYNVIVNVQAPPQVANLTINNGDAQRSRVLAMKVDFTSHVTLPANLAAAFTLKRQSDNAVVNLVPTVDNTGAATSVSFTFSAGPAVEFNSLADGRYTFTALSSQIADALGQPLDGNSDGVAGGDYVFVGSPANGLFRLFGDSDGNGNVNSADFLAFRSAFGGSSFAFDFNNNGSVDSTDFLAFRSRFGSSI